MAPGIILLVIGGIFAFAVKAESSWLDTDMLGLVLMLGGVGFIVRSRMARKEVVTREVVRRPGRGGDQSSYPRKFALMSCVREAARKS